ncbi:MAG: serine hydrolase domain-containing protein [Phycisphaeraceae bacterium]
MIQSYLPICVVLVLTLLRVGTATAADETAGNFQAFDEAVEKFMAEHEIAAGSLAVSINGEIVHTAAFGFRDADETLPVTPETPFRIASVAKPIASAVVRDLIAEEQLSLDTRLVDVLELQPPEGASMDPRWEQITIAHLLAHEGGFDRGKSGDPMFRDGDVQQLLGTEHPPTADEIITFMLARPLDFDPGERSAYSNFGYCLLGRVVEAVTGETFIEATLKRVAEPAGMPSLALGRTYAADRPDEEVHYPIRDGALRIERMDAHGGLIANAPDLCRFMDTFWISGEPRTARNGRAYVFFGGMPGTMSLIRQRADGIDFAVLFNRFSRQHYTDILERLDEAADTLTVD